MTEISKMFENAGFKKREIENCIYKNSTPCGHSCDDGEDCPYLEIKIDYPPFTADKQLELIKWLSTKELKIRINKQPYAIYIGILGNDNTCFFGCEGLYFEQTLAEAINNLWQSLTDQEKEEIRGILNE